MQEILEQLIELQKIDSKIASIEGVIKNTPSQIKAVQEKYEKAITGYDSIKAALDENKKTITLTDLTPREILSEGHQSELVTYKGVMVSKEHADKDMFKINLLNMINKEN